MTGMESDRCELLGPDAQLRGDLPVIADAPPIAPLPQGAEGQAGLGQDLGAQDLGKQDLGAQGLGAYALLYQSFKEQPGPRPAGFDGQGFDGQAPGGQPVLGARLRPIDIEDFIALDIPPRGMVLDPLIPEKGLAMLYGARSVGKTRVAHGIGYAVASGTGFLRWQAPKPRRVLVIDGELPKEDLRQRVTEVRSAAERRAQYGHFTIISADRVDRGIGNLGSPVVQAEVESLLDGVELLVIDNLSSLTVGVRENDSDAWGEIQEWLLRLRRRGVSVLLIHHSGKTGGQRGTSRREDVLDTSFSLRRPSDYSMDQGARFEVHIEKGRGVFGEHARPFEAWLQGRDGEAAWAMKDVEDAALSRVAALLAAGMSVREIAEETGATKSSVHRMKQRIERETKEREGGEEARGEGE